MAEKNIIKEIVSLFLKKGVLITEGILTEINRYNGELEAILKDDTKLIELTKSISDEGSMKPFFDKLTKVKEQESTNPNETTSKDRFRISRKTGSFSRAKPYSVRYPNVSAVVLKSANSESMVSE